MSTRYRTFLPLRIVRQYQCVVLGASRTILTVGITADCRSHALIVFLQVLTGCTIFPVLIESRRMQLLIGRIERYQRFLRRRSSALYLLYLPARARLCQDLWLAQRE